MAKPDWITLSKNSGSGNDTISVEAQPNAQRYCREGVITVNSGNGSISKQVKVLQYGAATYKLDLTFVGVQEGPLYKISGCSATLMTENAEDVGATYTVGVKLLNDGLPFELPDGSSTLRLSVSFVDGGKTGGGVLIFDTPFKVGNRQSLTYYAIEATSAQGSVWVDKEISTISYQDAGLVIEPDTVNASSEETTTSVFIGISDGDKWTVE